MSETNTIRWKIEQWVKSRLFPNELPLQLRSSFSFFAGVQTLTPFITPRELYLKREMS